MNEFVWFKRYLRLVARHQNYKSRFTVAANMNLGRCTPCDLIIKIYYLDECDRALELLGISKRICIKMANYIIDHQKELRKLDYYSENGFYNKLGTQLWNGYKLKKRQGKD